MQGAVGFKLLEKLDGGARSIGAGEQVRGPGLSRDFAIEGIVGFKEKGAGDPFAVFETVIDAQADAGDGARAQV